MNDRPYVEFGPEGCGLAIVVALALVAWFFGALAIWEVWL